MTQPAQTTASSGQSWAFTRMAHPADLVDSLLEHYDSNEDSYLQDHVNTLRSYQTIRDDPSTAEGTLTLRTLSAYDSLGYLVARLRADEEHPTEVSLLESMRTDVSNGETTRPRILDSVFESRNEWPNWLARNTAHLASQAKRTISSYLI